MDGIAATEAELAFAAVKAQGTAAYHAHEAFFWLDLGTTAPWNSAKDRERSVDHQRNAFYAAMSARLHLFALLDRA